MNPFVLGVLGKSQLQKDFCPLSGALLPGPPNLTYIIDRCASQPGMYDQEPPQLLQG